MNKILTILFYCVAVVFWPFLVIGMWFDEKYRQPKFRHIVGLGIETAIRDLDVGDIIYINDKALEVLYKHGSDQVVLGLGKYEVVSKADQIQLVERLEGEPDRGRLLNAKFWSVVVRGDSLRITFS